MNPNDADNLIRISQDDVASTHVDDMLKRQMSMRGDPGVSRDRNHVWYYQNWFILGVVGMFGAIVAWAILEPIFDDYLYIQGKITSVGDSSAISHARGNRSQRALCANGNRARASGRRCS